MQHDTNNFSDSFINLNTEFQKVIKIEQPINCFWFTEIYSKSHKIKSDLALSHEQDSFFS